MEERKFKNIGLILGVVLVAVAVAFAIQTHWKGRQPRPQETQLGREWTKLELILAQIQNNYVDSVDVHALIEKTLPSILEELDPHSVYLEPQRLQEADEELQGNIEGIGVLFNVPNDTAIVINVVVGGPAERMGLQSGDKIIKVDTTVIAGVKMPQDSMRTYMKGPKGTNVDIWIQRFGEKELIKFPIVRDKIPVHTVDVAYMVDAQTGYIKLSKFARTSYVEVLEAVSDLVEQGMKQVIFDIRGNVGGYLDQALKISGLFLDEGQLIVYTQGAHRPRQDFNNPQKGFCSEMPMAVLIDDASASSSEIMAGALQDWDRAWIVGRRSYGKGLVQEPIYFSDKSGLRLTVSRFYTPLGRSIQKPYDGNKDDYAYDILDRYRHGEFMQEDSIPKNDSLRYETKAGKVLYGGGGIIPDVFVPLDTVGMNDFYLKSSRLGLPIKFSMNFADKHRKEIKEISTMDALDAFYDRMPLEREFLVFAAANKVTPKGNEWQECKHIILPQLKAYVGRNTQMDDKAFYPYLGQIDNVLLRAKKLFYEANR